MSWIRQQEAGFSGTPTTRSAASWTRYFEMFGSRGVHHKGWTAVTRYNVLPLDDRTAERVNPDLAGRPTLIRGDSQLFFPGLGRLSDTSVVNMKNRSFQVTAEVTCPRTGHTA